VPHRRCLVKGVLKFGGGWHALRLCEGRGGGRTPFAEPQGVPPAVDTMKTHRVKGDGSRMIALVVSVNSKRVCSIGLTSDNTRSVGLSWIGHPDEGEVLLHVSGMDDREHVYWQTPQLKLGDEVTIKITECDVTDPPDTRKTVEEMDRWARSLRPKGQNF